jgi:hypothetical protein
MNIGAAIYVSATLFEFVCVQGYLIDTSTQYAASEYYSSEMSFLVCITSHCIWFVSSPILSFSFHSTLLSY